MEIKKPATMVHEQLLTACKEGSTKAQMEVYKLYYRAMYNISLRIVGDAYEAEDIMQESFLAAFEHLKTTDLTISFGGWLKKIVVNRSLDAVKKRKVYFEQVEDLQIADSPDEAHWNNSEESTESKVQKIRRAMSELPDKYRTILSLNLIEGYDHEEISEILGIPASTSRAQLSRGKQKLISMITI